VGGRESVVEDWDKRTPDQEYDAEIVEFVAKHGDGVRVVADCVVGGA
jgi:hypothetical protein